MQPALAIPTATEFRIQLDHAMRLERVAFAAKVRAARAVLSISQDELARQTGLTQKSIHRIEQGSVEPKMRTVLTIQQFWCEHGIVFEDLQDGGFRLAVVGSALQGG